MERREGSGTGKSTLLDIILGLLNPVKGKLMIDGVDAQSNLRGWQHQIRYVGQNIVLVDDTIRRNIAIGIPDDEINDKQIWKVIEAVQLSDFVSRLSEKLNT